MTLFKVGNFESHSSGNLKWKVECDALTDADWDGIVQAAVELGLLRTEYSQITPIPTGGVPFAESIKRNTAWYRGYMPEGVVLFVDDVLTTGRSMEQARLALKLEDFRFAKGIVAFARGPCPDWIKPVWRLG